MRINFFLLGLRENGGGSHQNAIVFVRALRQLGHTVNVFTFGQDSESPRDIKITVLDENSGSFAAKLERRARIFKENENDCDVFFVYGHSLLWPAGLYRKSGGSLPVAVYLDSHSDSMKEQYRYGFLHRIKFRAWELVRGLSFAKHIDCFCAVSPYLKDRYVKAGFLAEKFSIVPNAFDFKEPSPRSQRSVPRILFVARLSFEKGPDIFVDALALLKDKTWTARILGDGPLREPLEERIRMNGLSDRVSLGGWKQYPELPHEYAAADLLAASSRTPEPFGRAIVEAMHEGVPVIVPEGSGAAWVGNGAALTFERGSVESLKRTIQTLLTDSQKRNELASHTKVRARDFDAQKIGEKLSLALERLLV